jgi:ABC-type transport system involved in multi-copper enzyme maturation permease subunit
VSEIVTHPAGEAATTTTGSRRPWGPWRQQLAAIVRLELRKGYLGGRSLWLYLLALAPLVILGGRVVFASRIVTDPANLSDAHLFFALIYRVFTLRFVIMLGCLAIFGNLIRREMLERSLHYYFLTPLRRELLVVAKYLTGLIVTATLFSLSTVASFLLAYSPYQGSAIESFLLRGPGLGHLGAYVLVTVLACLGYGALFLTFGFLSDGPLALLADAPSPWVAIPGLIVFAAALVVLSAWKIRRMEVRYEAE